MDKQQTLTGFLIVALVLALGVVWLQRTIESAGREVNKSIQDIPEDLLRNVLPR
jgi:hypothetical protein